MFYYEESFFCDFLVMLFGFVLKVSFLLMVVLRYLYSSTSSICLLAIVFGVCIHLYAECCLSVMELVMFGAI